MVPLIVSLVLLILQLLYASSEVVYIVPEIDATVTCMLDTAECPVNESCLTISQIATNVSSISFQQNITLTFLPGCHKLSETISINNVTTLMLRSSSPDPATVTCDKNGNFVFENIDRLRIRGLLFTRCPHRVATVQELSIEDSVFDGNNTGVSSLDIEQVSNATISDSLFKSNVKVSSSNERLSLFLQAFDSECVKIYNLLEYIGGALTVFYSVVSIDRTNFESNTARIGGAVYSANSNITMTDCSFIDNAASLSEEIVKNEESTGGAIYSVGSTTVIESSTFKNNTAAGSGGAIFNDGELIIANGTCFDFNTAYLEGGALNNFRGNATINTGNNFTHNLAHRDGGAVYNRQTLIITNSNTFDSNFASNDGGALYNSGTLLVSDANHFISSTTEGNGGALYNNGELNITNSNVFESNTAQRNGGGIYNAESSFSISDGNRFVNNLAMIDGGALWTQFGNNVIQNDVSFINNRAIGDGGALWVRNADLIIRNGNIFHKNIATMDGGMMWIQYSTLLVVNRNTFSSNIAENDGGAFYLQYCNATVTDNNVFDSNEALDDGGAILGRDNELVEFLNGTLFRNNTAAEYGGGTFFFWTDKIVYSDTEFINNTAVEQGGGLRFYDCDLVLSNVLFLNNTAVYGAALLGHYLVLVSVDLVNITNNTAECDGAVYIDSFSKVKFYGETEMKNNIGSLSIDDDSSVEFFNNASFINLRPTQCSLTGEREQGGAITITDRGGVTFHENALFENNQASIGGAILAKSNSLIDVRGNVTIKQNVAQLNGAGVAIFESNLIVSNSMSLNGNSASEFGGGIYSLSSTVQILNGSLHLSRNQARHGGGLYLDQDSKLWITEQQSGNETSEMNVEQLSPQLQFTDNYATAFGGAIYVNDENKPAVCRSSVHLVTNHSECFFQISLRNDSDSKSRTYFHFYNNSAQRGAALYGGLLDRCTLNSLEDFEKPVDYLQRVSNLDEIDTTTQAISSEPVRVCFCLDGLPNCTHQPPSMTVELDQIFTISVAAVDQANNSLASTIYSSLHTPDGHLARTLLNRNTSQNCTQLAFDDIVSSPRSTTHNLVLYANGPCSDKGISQRSIELDFQTCQEYCTTFVGFQLYQSNFTTTCQCRCHKDLPYITNCSSSTGELVRDGDYWINVLVNETTNKTENSFYSVRFCPYDYCLPSTERISISLTHPQGSDAQCAHNRTGKACGSCKEGLSLVFGSSRCAKCSNAYLALLIPFAIAGILIVVFLLLCNLTVAVGTMNGVIFYANIVVANRAIFFPFGVTTGMTVFISWLSLSVGFETCFYDGMNGYAKVLLQFLFDLYLIALVVVIMAACHYSQRLSNILGNKNPVATFATLVLYAYEKSTRKLYSLLSFAVVYYTSGEREVVWLFDPNVRYLQGGHIALFLLCALITIFGFVFNLLLLFGHCFTRLPNRRPFKLMHHPKFMSLLDAYQAPYKPHHRYWVGLLLLVREVLYMFLEVNAAGDDRISLLVVISIGVGLLSFKLFAGGIYKSRVKDILETTFILNLTMFAVITFHGHQVGINQSDIAHASFTIAFFTFLGILVYHTYKYFLKGTVIRKCTDKYLYRLKEKFFDCCPCFSTLGDNKTKERNNYYDSSMESYANTLQCPLNLLDRNPSTNEYRQAEHPNDRRFNFEPTGCVTSGVVEITQYTPPLTRILGHERTNVLVDPDSAVATSQPAQREYDDSGHESATNTRSIVSTNLSADDRSTF